MPCREAFDHVVDRSLALVAFLRAQGPAAVHNMDNLLLRESMDVIGTSLCLASHSQADVGLGRGSSVPPDSRHSNRWAYLLADAIISYLPWPAWISVPYVVYVNIC